jgi:hypothetical protein
MIYDMFATLFVKHGIEEKWVIWTWSL